MRKEKQFFVAVIIVCLLAIIIGFFLHGGKRGLYLDDYTFRAWAFDFEKGGWRPQLAPIDANFRYLHSILIPNLVNAIPSYEFPVRLFQALIIFINTLLLGLVAYRTVRTRLIFTITVWLFLMPVLANEAVLWLSGSSPFLLGTLAFLVGLHIFLTAVSKSNPVLLIAAALFLGMVPLFCEASVFLVLLFPLLSLFRVAGDIRVRLKTFLSASVFCFLVSFGYGLYWHLILRHAPQVAWRGGAEFDPVFVLTQRVPEVWGRLVWLVTDWGIRGPLAEALYLGAREWMSSWVGWMFLVSLVVGVLTVVLSYPAVDKSDHVKPSVVWSTVLAGLAWAGLTLVPILLLRDQIVEVRTLYPTWAGLSIAMAAFLQGVTDLGGRWRLWIARLSLAVAGVILLVSSLTMAGMVRVYQLRWDLDQRQLAAFRSAIPALPEEGPIWLLPVTLDERSVSPTFGKEVSLDRYLLGVFETTWSASGALKIEYRQQNINAVASHRWGRLHITDLVEAASGQIEGLVVQGQEVPIRSLIAFTFREGEVILLDPLILVTSNGEEVIVDLPLTKRYSSMGVNREAIRLPLE